MTKNYQGQRKYAGFLGQALDNWLKSIFHLGMTDTDKEVAETNKQDQLDLMHESQNLKESFYNKYESLPAQVAQAQSAGVNPFMLFQGGASVSASSAPSAGSPTASAQNQVGFSDLLGTLLNYKLGQRKLDIEEELLPYRQGQLGSQTELNFARVQEINTLLPVRVENLSASTDLLIEKIHTEETVQALNNAGVTEREASAAVKVREAAILAIDESKRQEFLESEIELNRSSEALNRAAAARDYKECARITQEIENLKVGRDNMLKEGVGILINNGKMAHEFSILGKEDANTDKRIKQENAGRVVDMITKSVDTVVGVVSAGAGVQAARNGAVSAAASVSRASSYARDVSARIDRYNRPRRSR